MMMETKVCLFSGVRFWGTHEIADDHQEKQQELLERGEGTEVHSGQPGDRHC